MAKENKRSRQIAELVRRNIGEVFQQEGGNIYGFKVLVTVTRVKMSPDFGIAKVYLSVYNTENKQAILLLLEEEMHNIRTSFYSRIRKQMRRMPNIQFYLDDTLDEIDRVDSLFDRLYSENQMGSDPIDENS